MTGESFFYLGKILKTHGNKGHVVVHLDVDDPEEYRELESVFLDLQGERIPFFITSVELKAKGKALFHFQDFNTADEATVMQGLKMYLPAAALPKLRGNRFYYHEIVGFVVTDEARGEIGILEEVLDLPHQSLFSIRFQGKEILLPVVDEVIVKVDRRHKRLLVRAPEGLLDIYI
jgi:16S rRNA processing protein RimM